MKTLILSITWFALTISCESPYKRQKSNQASVAVSVILDVTDTQRAYWPKGNDVLRLYHYAQNPNSEGLFRLRAISDKRLAPVISYRLADTESMGKDNDDDPQFRNKSIIAFYSTVRAAMNNFYSQTDTSKSLSNSECFRVISDELVYLSKIKSDQRILIVASDLMEKSDLMDCYSAGLSSSKTTAKIFDKFDLLPKDLTGVTVIFLFNPTDRNADKKFAFMSEVYSILLKSKNAKIKVQANL